MIPSVSPKANSKLAIFVIKLTAYFGGITVMLLAYFLGHSNMYMFAISGAALVVTVEASGCVLRRILPVHEYSNTQTDASRNIKVDKPVT